MRLEDNIAAPPPALSPELRYASLHRAIEKGIDSDSTYVELVKVCLQLGKQDEARNTFAKVNSPRERVHLQNLLLRHRVIEKPVLTAEECGIESIQVRRSFRGEIAGAGHFLFVDHMPLTTITMTAAFPLVVGLGGFVSQKLHSPWLANIALLPALFALAIVFAVARRVLLDARRGLEDAPSLHGSKDMLLEGGFAMLDTVLLGTLFLGPGIVMTQLDVPLPGSLLALAVGAFLLPMALMLRVVRCDWQSLSLQTLFATIVKGGLPYVRTAGTIAALFLPALLAGISTSGSRLYLALSVIGPLSVAPLFLAARLMGRLVDAEGERLGAFAAEPVPEPVHEDESVVRMVKLERKKKAPIQRRESPLAKKLEAAAQQRAPQQQLKRIASTPAPAPLPKPKPAAAAPAPVKAPAQSPKPAPAPVAPRKAVAQPTRTTAAARPAPASPAPRSRPAPAPVVHAAPAELPPELASMPGLVVRPGSSRQQPVKR